MKLSKSYTPGYWRADVPSAASAALDAIAAVMIPGQAPYPSGGEVAVAAFIGSRCDPEEATVLAGIADEFVAGGGDAAALTAIESARPVDFGLLRFYIYSGYYCAPAVLVAVAARSDYHASPQPLGYAVDAPVPIPTVRRGTFVPTAQVRKLFHV